MTTPRASRNLLAMAREANVNREDGWFVGERKTLAYTVYQADGETPQVIDGWTVEWRLYKRRQVLPAMVLPGVVVWGAGGRVNIEVFADSYLVDAGTYEVALWRIDPGFEAVLAQNTVVLRAVQE